MQYWINQNGVQSGPVTREELEKMDVSADAYVWRSGLDDWVKITTLPELEGVIGNAAPAEEKAAPAEEAPAIPAEESAPIIIPDLPQPDEQPALQPQYVAQQQVPQLPQQPGGECPPTNMVWAIITTLMCCTPVGAVAIYYALKVKKKYAMGDYEGAQRASETGAWWCIASIILNIVSAPFSMLIQLMMQ